MAPATVFCHQGGEREVHVRWVRCFFCDIVGNGVKEPIEQVQIVSFLALGFCSIKHQSGPQDGNHTVQSVTGNCAPHLDVQKVDCGVYHQAILFIFPRGLIFFVLFRWEQKSLYFCFNPITHGLFYKYFY